MAMATKMAKTAKMTAKQDSTPRKINRGMTILDVKSVDTFYGPIQALRGVSINVQQGEIVTIIGANGAGKSTMLNTIFANPCARHGEILYEGEHIEGLITSQIARKGLSLVPEGRRIFPAMTVEENLYMGCIHLDEGKVPDLLKSVYDMFPFLKERRSQRGGTLSGGEQQMLAIARSLMSDPDFMLLDEPSLGLAPIIVKRIFDRLKEISTRGITILLVEQNASIALQLADRGYVLTNGKISLTGTGAQLLKDPEVKKAYLGG